MKKVLSMIVLGAVGTALLLASCDANTTSDDESTQLSEEMVQIIEKSSPVTSGNLITKTNSGSDGNVYVEYYDNNDNLVEEYVWNDDEFISHTVTTYTQSNLYATKEFIAQDGSRNLLYSYEYENESLVATKLSEYENGLLKKSTTTDADGNVTGYSVNSYNSNNQIEKIEIFNADDVLSEYYTYTYDSEGRQTKYSACSADGTVLKYTAFEYSENGTVTEKYFDAKGTLEKYFIKEYFKDGNIKSNTEYDSQGNIISQDIFEESYSTAS